jgi:UDP:flavonoid glycosyltransferase YjiC (YdhE family)
VLRPGEVTADSVRSAVERVLGETGFARAAGRVAQEIEQMGTPAEAAAAVEEHGASR